METRMEVSDLAAVLLATPKADVRYYLNGVLVEFDAAGAIVVGTDGHRLHVVRTYDGETEGHGGSIIVPRDLVETITKGGKKVQSMSVTITSDGRSLQLQREDGVSVSGQAIDGRFPDYRRVLPTRSSCEEGEGGPGQFNPILLADAQKAATLAADMGKLWSIIVYHRGPNNAALVLSEAAPRFCAVVMPVRTNDEAALATNSAFEAATGMSGQRIPVETLGEKEETESETEAAA